MDLNFCYESAIAVDCSRKPVSADVFSWHCIGPFSGYYESVLADTLNLCMQILHRNNAATPVMLRTVKICL